MTIRLKLLFCLGALAAAMVAIGASGFVALESSSERMRSIVVDRVTPLAQLKLVADMYAVNIVDTAHKVRDGALTWEEGQASFTKALNVIDVNWKAYMATYLTEDESKLAKLAESAMSAANYNVGQLQAITAAHDQAKMDQFVRVMLYPTIDPIGGEISQLIDLQTRVAGEEYTAAEAGKSFSLWIMGIVGLLSLLALSTAAYIVVFGVVRPLIAMQMVMTRLAHGALEVEIPSVGKKDEIGDMASAVQVFKDNAIERARLAAEQAEAQEAKERRARFVDDLIRDFDKDTSSILNIVSAASTELEATASSLNAAAEESSQTAQSVATASGSASSNVQTVAAASEELTASIGEISQQVHASLDVTKKALLMASETDQTVQGLVATADRIGTVVKLISDIAAQTNLLALNATIEAARAGDSGRGFAVVASEVKNLAGQTAKATEEIASQIQEIQTVTGRAATAIQGIGATIRDINGAASAIATAVEQQGAATREIAMNISMAADGTQEVSANIAGVTESATQTGAGAAQVLSSAEELATQASTLKSKVEGFFRDIRAA